MALTNNEIEMRCSRCLQPSPLAEMHYGTDGKQLVCNKCERLRWERLDNSAPRPRAPGTTYKCTTCGFAFQRARITPRLCPYCGKESVTRA